MAPLYGERLKHAARAILFDLLARAETAWIGADGTEKGQPEAARDAATYLVSCLERDDASGKAGFRRVGELAAELVYGAWHHPAEFSAIFSSVTDRETPDGPNIATWQGLRFLSVFHSDLIEWSGYVLDPAQTRPVVRHDGDCGVYVPPLTPDAMAAALREYRVRLRDPQPAVAVCHACGRPHAA